MEQRSKPVGTGCRMYRCNAIASEGSHYCNGHTCLWDGCTLASDFDPIRNVIHSDYCTQHAAAKRNQEREAWTDEEYEEWARRGDEEMANWVNRERDRIYGPGWARN